MKMLANKFVWFVLLLGVQWSSAWKWKCENDENCIRVNDNEESDEVTVYYNSIEVCRLVCGDQGPVWPRPGLIQSSKQLIYVHPNDFQFKFNAPQTVANILQENVEIFKRNVLSECHGENLCQRDDVVKIQVTVDVRYNDLALNWSTNEGYSLKLNDAQCEITAATFYGARHAMETLSQLISAAVDSFQMPLSFQIHDKPVFSHRGVLLDSSRNFISVDVIKRQLNGMAASKMNYLHWHISDSQSFPFFSSREPNLTAYGAISEDKIYTPMDVQELNRYALVHGVRIIMEIDAPSHAGNGWQWGTKRKLGHLAVCVNQQPWRSYCIEAPCGQLNPANKHVYDVLENLYQDIADAFLTDIFHMGGDEVFFPCWNSSDEIIHYLKSKERGQELEDFLFLWNEFQEKALERYDKVAGNSKSNIIMWSSELTNPERIEKYLDKNRYVIETWVPSTDPLPRELIEKGYKLIISTKNAWYLDHGFWGITKYYTWRTVYNNRIISHQNVLGGEVCMWGEFIDEAALDGRIWPRAAAAAERLWANPNINSEKAEARMLRHRERLVSRNISAEALAPNWCYQNEGQCF